MAIMYGQHSSLFITANPEIVNETTNKLLVNETWVEGWLSHLSKCLLFIYISKIEDVIRRNSFFPNRDRDNAIKVQTK